ncbi:hypothetical protein SAMN04487950_3931 [Halogranum rubrum]|uniref:DUF8055 domain-containing protein n=1 Tax=Halogranum rubrum TaxID=553466 RepID=A0A1I4I4U9_9EURY|nr:hypothetical protein [Halogranum rubrum]SFL48756.1 hypothetical protein SAMN04487950_3931 [Halogranum rubrum]
MARLVEQSRRECAAFDPATDDPQRCLTRGIQPIVALYVEVRQADDDALSPVEQSLLERALNDWLSLYAAGHDAAFHAHFTVHELAVAYAAHGELRATVDDLLGL